MSESTIYQNQADRQCHHRQLSNPRPNKHAQSLLLCSNGANRTDFYRCNLSNHPALAKTISWCSMIMTAMPSSPSPSRTSAVTTFLQNTSRGMSFCAKQDYGPNCSDLTMKHLKHSKSAWQPKPLTSNWYHHMSTIAMQLNEQSEHSRTTLLQDFAVLTRISHYTYGINSYHRLHLCSTCYMDHVSTPSSLPGHSSMDQLTQPDTYCTTRHLGIGP